MRRFFSAHKKLHCWLLGNLALLTLFWLTRGQRAWMNAVADHVTTPLRRTLGAWCSHFPFSVMEVLVVLLAALGALYALWSVIAVIRAKGRRGRRAYGAVLGGACFGLSIYVGICLLWGVNYYTDSFQDRSGIVAQDVAAEDLLAVTQYFAHRLGETADTVARDENGLFAVSRDEIFGYSGQIYGPVTEQFPFLAFDDPLPKRVYFSPVMSALGFTGVYCPYTGETNLNVDCPPCLLPATIAHELAHQRAIASEQECNFLAVLAATTCGSDVYAYSGWLLGYIYLGNALYRLDQTQWRAVYDSLPETVKLDLAADSAYWAQFQGPAAKASEKVYTSFLQSYGETRGMQSYGAVVDLLVVYYKNAANAR
ncbi:MAG: DUF3810 domain-containing protein [Oscillibacter sp.]